MKSLSHVWLFATSWTIAYQAPPSMGFSRQEYWSGMPLPSPSDPLQLSESWQNHYTWEVCSANWWDTSKTATLAASSGHRKGLILLHDKVQLHVTQPTFQKLNEQDFRSFASSVIFTWLASQLPHLQASQQLFAVETLPQPAWGRKYFLKVHQILKHRFLH